jgi:hypothetical protein
MTMNTYDIVKRMHADWSDLQYTVPTKQQEQAALAKLLTSPKWKISLTDKERELLSRQIE